LNNAINPQSRGGKARNGTTSRANNDNFVIDDCGEAQGNNNKPNKKSGNNRNDIAMSAIGSADREKNVDFVEEWMNTFAFLSREFSFFLFFLIFHLVSGMVFMSHFNMELVKSSSSVTLRK
jgi:hypothetical protein